MVLACGQAACRQRPPPPGTAGSLRPDTVLRPSTSTAGQQELWAYMQPRKQARGRLAGWSACGAVVKGAACRAIRCGLIRRLGRGDSESKSPRHARPEIIPRLPTRHASSRRSESMRSPARPALAEHSRRRIAGCREAGVPASSGNRQDLTCGREGREDERVRGGEIIERD